ncbi:FHA domain-containing protein [Streptomyces sp. G44]|uniref:FHA domain-containing protein n=1 Tax=Streptomyces sp. G44 TaxID=2807632 RepID=UPI00195F58B6|nr:FHA domain-containing protein [Streptomyces sp. G44]MBM7167178.1 FHA domain-containing protein [Streptomyces sp. G44]
MPTCPNGHQSGSDDWCEVCGHRMAGAVPPPPPPPPAAGYGYPPAPPGQNPDFSQPGPGRPHPAAVPDQASEAELCPQCRTPREANAPFCEECRWNFLTNTATSYTPAAPLRPLPNTQGGPGAPAPRPGQPFQQQPPPGGHPGHPGQPGRPGQDAYEYQGSRPSQMNRPAEPIPPFGNGPGNGPGGGPGQGGPGQGGPGQAPPGAPQAFQQQPGPPAPPAFPQETGAPQGPPPPPQPGSGGPSFGGGSAGGGDDDWVISPPSSAAPPQQQQQQPFQRQDVFQPVPPRQQAPQHQAQQHQAPQQPQQEQQEHPQQQVPQQQAPQGPGTWTATIGPDREYFMAMMQRSGPEASGLNLPAYSPEQQRPLAGNQITIGRRRHSTGDTPDIDLSVPPEDPGVSHQHAILVQQPDGGWAVVDQNSTNGTTVNGGEEPIQPFVPVPLQDGDRVHVGAWTTITVRRD